MLLRFCADPGVPQLLFNITLYLFGLALFPFTSDVTDGLNHR